MASWSVVGLLLLAVGMTLIKAQERKSYAELNSPFIFKSVEKLKMPTITRNVWDMEKNELNKELPDTKGLYLMYYDQKDHKYPIYVGTTAKSFKKALQEHYNREDGAVRQILEGSFPTNRRDFPLANLKVKLIDMPKEVEAKVFERAFLETFYFALNDQSNRGKRLELDNRNEVVKVSESKGIFDMQFKNILNDVQNMYSNYENAEKTINDKSTDH